MLATKNIIKHIMDHTNILKKIKFNASKQLILTRANLRQSSTTSQEQQDSKLQYYKTLNEAAQQNENVKPPGWDEALPFEEIPGPKPLPIIGNAWRFFPKIGTYSNMDILDVFKQFQHQYGKVSVLKGLPGRPPMVYLYDIADIEKMYRNEGPWPIRVGNNALLHYRTVTRKNWFKYVGLIVTQGEDWFKFRTIVNPILMQPRNVLQYIEGMNIVADEFIDNMNYFSTLNPNGEMPEDFNNELYKWALESICVVAADKHLGCLKRDTSPNSEPQKLIESVIEFFDLMYKLEVMPSLWKYYNTKTWKRFVEVMDFMTKTSLKYVNESIASGAGDKKNTVLANLLKVDKDVALSMTADLLPAGIDTTGRVMGAVLYYLARFPDKQAQLRKEATDLLEHKNSPVTKEILERAKYLKATMRETLRLSPIAIGNKRAAVKDMVLGGYRIPKGTDILAFHMSLCTSEETFPKAKEFVPERWLANSDKEISHKNSNAFVTLPFGYGPRSCPGRRLANLELETAILKIVRNFELSWPHEDMVFTTGVFHGIGRPLKMWVKPLDK